MRPMIEYLKRFIELPVSEMPEPYVKRNHGKMPILKTDRCGCGKRTMEGCSDMCYN